MYKSGIVFSWIAVKECISVLLSHKISNKLVQVFALQIFVRLGTVYAGKDNRS